MPGYLIRTQAAFDECRSHLHDSGAAGSPVESYLAEHILIVLCADMEQALYDIADQWTRRSSDDPALRAFVSKAIPRLLRSLQKNEIATFIGSFGAERQSRFNDMLDEKDVTIYGNAVRERNNVAHRQGGAIAFMDLPHVIEAAHKILASAEVALA